ncbi:MAG: PAS domain S-box protein, partial [Azonexus sp.]|nr:PAS domain S-box protein [Azonexus sp.]
LCLPKLRSELKALCYRLIQENLDNLQGSGVNVEIDGEELRIRPVLRRIAHPSALDESAFLISFEEIRTAERSPESAAATPDDHHFEEIIRLRQELADSREHLQAVIEELEASNEELQSLNEEVQSSSEELQSSNEELQSSNEELTTLNDELRVKSLEALQLTTTLSNVQNSIRTSLVVVDHDGRITRYNALATRIFGLVANDIGQFLYGIPCHLQLPGLRQQVSEVVATGNSLIEQVRQGEFHYLMQLDPYRNELGENVGAVLTFADISDLHRAELAQQSSELRFQQVWEASLEGLLVVNSQGRITLANPALDAMFGYTPGELIGQAIEILIPEALRARHVDQRDAFSKRSEQTRHPSEIRNLHGRRQNGSEFPVEISLSGMTVNGEYFVLASVSDITERQRLDAEL